MPWYRLTFQAGVVQDLTHAGLPMGQRLLEKTKWIASNVENLRHDVMSDFPGLHKYAVSDWRIFYAIDRNEGVVEIHAVIHKNALKR